MEAMMSIFNSKKLLKQLTIPLYLVITILLMVMINRVTRLSMESRMSTMRQQMAAEKVVYEQRIASLLERLEAGRMTEAGITKTYDELSELNDLLVRVKWTDSELDRLNEIIYKKLLQRYPESAARILMEELRGEHGDWAHHFMTDYVTDDHLKRTLILSLRTMARSERNRQLRERAEQILALYEGKTK
jgi:cell shape-determining protein MreC